MKVYIAGPMSGYPELNFPAFYSLEAHLEQQGIDVVNPARLDDAGLPDNELGMGLAINKQKFLLRDFRELVNCDGIVMLPDWQSSTGANCELAVARMVGLEVWEADYVYHMYGNGDVVEGWTLSKDSLEQPDMERISDYMQEGMLAQLQRRMMPNGITQD